ncbi:MAG: hypothetical protein Q4D41_00245 [Prevotellaceae bacterium]|nr:hypothetical protein [Prevotellaceae bacterium]
MAKKVYDTDGLDLHNVNWEGDENTGNLPVSGRLVEKYIKSIDESCANITPVDEVVSGETKPPTSGAVFDSIVGTVTDVDVTDSEDGTQYVMTVTKKNSEGGETSEEVRFSKYTDEDKVVVGIDLTGSDGSALPSSQYLSEGDDFVVKYAINVATAGGSEVTDYSDLKARVIVKRGSTTLSAFKDTEFVSVSAGQEYTFDASEYLTDATAYTIQVEAQATYQGSTLSRTASARVTVVAMELATTFSVGNGLSAGGYSNDVNIPFTAKGTSGEKTIYYRLNGGTPYTESLSTGSGTQSKNITIPLTEMAEGLNVVEAYAMHESSGVISDVFYITLLKAGDSVADYVGLMFSHSADGFQDNYLEPVLNAEQFTAWSFDYSAYSSGDSTATLSVVNNGNVVKEDSLTRGATGSYGKTNVSVEALTYTVTCGTATLMLSVSTSSHSDIEASLASDAVGTFEAYGRSNSETNPASWTSGDLRMEFEDVLWSVNSNGAGSGWYNDRLLLSNGAKMNLTADGGYRPFNEDDKPVGYAIADVGMTIEIEYSTANVSDTDAELITCLGTLSNGNRYGLVVTAEEAKFLTGVTTEAVDAGETLTYEDSVGTKFEPNTNIKITYVFYPNVSTNEQRGLIGFFVNGVESAASRWLNKVNFDIDSQLEFNSVGADLSIKSIRIYNKALTDDEVLNNYIVDRNHLEDEDEEKGVRTLDEENRVLNEGETVSLEKLLALRSVRKNSILILYGTGSVSGEVPSDSDTLNIMDALAQLNNKSSNKLCSEIRFYNGEDSSLDWILYNAYVRIQGTSSVNYARKNLRFYFQKTASGYTVTLSVGEIDSNGNQTNPTVTTGKKNLFKLRQDSVGAKLACPKCDFSDSSMTTNTGGAKFINDGLLEMGLLTPAQSYAQDHPDTCTESFRSAIDGMPCDLFVAKSTDEDLTYYGQYNINNDKSDSYPVFGQDDTIGAENWGEGDTLNYLNANDEGTTEFLPICIETLNNSNDCCLFHWLPSTDANHIDFMDNNFDNGFELNHPKDNYWIDGGGDADEEPNLKEHIGLGDTQDKMYKAIDRMMSFIHDCVLETTAGANMTYNTETHTFDGVDYTDTDDGKFPTDKWTSATFAANATKYFNIPYLIAYYLYVDFNLGVDQLAKNMLLRTWDGVIWYITYYDGDCQLGSDNKSFLTGEYDDNRQTRRDGAYVMQGHNSWLWNLIIANFSDLMTEILTSGYNGGTSFMSAFSVQKALDHFDTEQMDKWCARLYNKSGIFKYIYPFLNAMPVGADGATQTYPQIYGMKGCLKEHRNFFINRRYDLKQVEYGYVSTLGAQFYQSTSSLDAAYKLAAMTFVLTIPYRVQISTSNGVQSDSGVVDAETETTLQLTSSFGENDPLKIIGAAKMKELTWHEDAFAIGFNFGLFSSLVKLDMSVDAASGYRNASFMTSTEAMVLLEEMNMKNNMLARNGDSGSVASLDLSYQSRLKYLDVRGTGLQKVTLATGAPITELYLPNTITELFLEDLTKLTESGLVLDSINNITGFRYSNCPGIDGFALLEKLHAAAEAGTGKLERFRVEVDMEDDGTVLAKYFGYKTYTSAGSNDNTHSGFVGTVRLTKYIDEETIESYRAKYSELTIIQPEYTVLEFDDSVSDDANVSNLDNKTGYKYGTEYEPNAHISAILAKRHRVLAKMTKKPSETEVTIAGVETTMNNLDGEMTYYPLHDSDSQYYGDADDVDNCTNAALDGTEGDVMMFEPKMWFKGINDYLNSKHYSCYSSNDEMPTTPDVDVLTYDEISAADNVISGYALIPKTTLSASYTTNSSYSVCKVNVDGYKKVRFPTVLGSNLIGSVFTDGSDNVVGNVVVSTLSARFENGMYVIADIPDGASDLYFTIQNTAEFDKVVLSNSDKIEDMEPDWVEEDEYLCAVFKSSAVNNKLRSCITGGSSTASLSWTDFHYYSVARGMQQIDPLMHNRIANLFYAKYGRRGSQEQCGHGTHTNTRTTGGTKILGMTDTLATDGTSTSGAEGNNSTAYYLKSDGSYGTLANTNCLGYEDIYGHKYEMMDRVDLPNDSNNTYKWRIWMPDGSIRLVKGSSTSGLWIAGVAHGKYMDVIPVGTFSGSSTTYYMDIYYVSSSSGRVVYRGYINANAVGGVSNAVAFHDASNSATVVGSRLAFRGQIVKAESVEAFKAITEVA